MVRSGGKRLLLAVWKAIGGAVYPEGAQDAAFRRAFEEEAQESNARIVRWMALLAAPLNVVFSVVLLRRPPDDAAAATWVFWTVCSNMVLAALCALAGVVAWYGRPRVVSRYLGDLMGSVWVFG